MVLFQTVWELRWKEMKTDKSELGGQASGGRISSWRDSGSMAIADARDDERGRCCGTDCKIGRHHSWCHWRWFGLQWISVGGSSVFIFISKCFPTNLGPDLIRRLQLLFWRGGNLTGFVDGIAPGLPTWVERGPAETREGENIEGENYRKGFH